MKDIDDIIREDFSKGRVFRWTKDEWIRLGEFLRKNGFVLEGLGVKHTLADEIK